MAEPISPSPTPTAAGPSRLEAVTVLLMVILAGAIVSIIPTTVAATTSTGVGGCASYNAIPGPVGAVAIFPTSRPSTAPLPVVEGSGGTGGGGGGTSILLDLRFEGGAVLSQRAVYLLWVDFASANATADWFDFTILTPTGATVPAFAVELTNLNGSAIAVFDSARSTPITGGGPVSVPSGGWSCGGTASISIGDSAVVIPETSVTGDSLVVHTEIPGSSPGGYTTNDSL